MIERCVCGSDIVAESGEPEMIFIAVRYHNRTASHQRWRRTRERVASRMLRRPRTRKAIHDTRLVKALLRETVGIK